MKKNTYSNPWEEIEARANEYSSKGLLAMVIVIIIVWALTATGFFVIDKSMMTKAALSGILGLLSLRALLGIFDNSKRWLKYVVLALICIICGIIVSVLSFHAVLLYAVPLFFATQYSKPHVIWYTYAINSVCVAVSSLAAFYYGFCDLNIFFVSMYDYNHFLEIMENDMCLAMNPNPVFIILVYATIPRCLLLALFSYLLLQITAKSRAEASQLARAKMISETDFVTGVFNKNKYAEMIKDYYPKLKKVGVVFWDINNLKEVNDEYGHEMGDLIISELATVLLQKPSKRIRVYRVGGDEFLTIIDNPSPNEEKKVERDTITRLTTFDSKATVDVSVAHGTASGSGSDITKVVNEADAAMYACKRKMKGENDVTPR